MPKRKGKECPACPDCGGRLERFHSRKVGLRYRCSLCREVFTAEQIAQIVDGAEKARDCIALGEFDGPHYDSSRDGGRLRGQLLAIFNFMCDGRWRTLGEIHQATGAPEASISAQLRHLRKRRFGAHTVNLKAVGGGLYCYRLVVNKCP